MLERSRGSGVYLSTLVDAGSAAVRERIELATAAGESIGTVARVPEGWAFGRLSKRSRQRSSHRVPSRTAGWLARQIRAQPGVDATRSPIAKACARPRQEHFDLHPLDPGEDPQNSD
jgi:hypothetical protein